MRIAKKSRKILLSLLLVTAILISVVASTLVVRAEKTDKLAAVGADNYYLWGQFSNDPDFGAMSTPTGSFSYDGTKGYYYYDIQNFTGSGDFCFVVSKINNSGASAARTPAVGGAASGGGGKYYLSQGNYHGYACMHLWNPAREKIRIYFSSEGMGLNAIPLDEAGSTPGNPTTPTTSPGGSSGYVYCENAAGWGAVYAYMWNSDSDKNAAWPGVKMENISGSTWRYRYTKSYANIIFNIGSDQTQTTDMAFPGNGKVYNNSTKQWSTYSGTAPTDPVNPTTAPPVSGSYVYCKNTAGWGEVYAYMWNSDSDKNAAWPGVKMENIGSSIWRYAVPKDFSSIIFNIGSDKTQTDDLTFYGAGYMYDNSTGQWSRYGDGPDPTSSVTPTSVTPTSSGSTTAPPSGQKVVYCENAAGWSNVTIYMWNGAGSVNNGKWPGVSMTKIGNNIWKYILPKDFEKVIFSESGNNQSDDMAFPGSGMIYNNKTKTWDVYDTSPLQVQSFGTDLEAPQYAGVGITLSARATGEGTVFYKFSVGTTVLHDYSTLDSVLWTPKSAGTYTLNFEFRDSKGNTNKRTATYTIADGSSVAAPFIKTVSPTGGSQIKKSAECTVNVTAGGGNTGTKKLFYKFTVLNASGTTVNVPYYTKSTSFKFTPTALGKYTVIVSVQNNDNMTVENSYVYNSVDNVISTEPATAPSVNPTSSQPTGHSGGASLIGDADMDGEVSILDATRIQRFLADLATEAEIDKKNADADHDNEVTILDATRIQRFIASLIDQL